MDPTLENARVAVVGLGLTGLSMARWLHRCGAQVRVHDSRAQPPGRATLASELPQVRFEGGLDGDCLAGADLVALSPGVPREEPAVQRMLARGVPVVGDIELFARAVAPMAPPVLAITGSNGKSTVTEMAGAICRAAGLPTVVAGNIGLPVLDALAAAWPLSAALPVFVLELSSFQLESTETLLPRAATCLNITQDHLDRYADMDAYAAAKARVFQGDGLQVLNRDDPRCMAQARAGRAQCTFGLGEPPAAEHWGLRGEGASRVICRGNEAVLPVSELRVAGLHNGLNAQAALALTAALGIAQAPAVAALCAFAGLAHRVQRIARIDGVDYYDDSKGTNVGATVAALDGFDNPVVLIAGGDGKGQDFAPLAPAVARRARAVILIGRDAPAIRGAVAGTGVPLVDAADLPAAVQAARAHARAGDCVLLSPACASFDMFRDYAHRAQVFIAAVATLEPDA